MKALIIGASKKVTDNGVRSYYEGYVDFFKRSAATAHLDAVIETCLMDDLIISVGDGSFSIYDTHNQQDLTGYDVFILRGDNFRRHMDVIGTINEFAKENDIPIINEYNDVKDSSKLLQAVQFHKLSIPVARTLYVNPGLLAAASTLEWEFPCVMKAVHGSHGNYNYVVHSFDDVRSHLGEDPENRFVLQRFIPNDGDYRVLIIGDEVLVIGRSAVGDSHLNNTSQGGEAVLIPVGELPAHVVEDSRKIMKYSGMTIAGVDVIVNKNTGEYSFLEVNAQPQLQTGAFIDQKEILMGKLLSKF
jgi:glutathione synthase/RimK-type ligase-like ATP-grasp enzyme